MDLRHAARLLGGEASAGRVMCPGPGHSRHDRSLSVRFCTSAPDGFLVESFAADPWDVCKDHVRRLLGLEEFRAGQDRPISTPVLSVPPKLVEETQSTARALSLWAETVPIAGTPAERYLASRGLSYGGEALRWHPSCPFGRGVKHGCMIGLVRNIVTNEPQAIHRTAIDTAGRKIDRKAYGPIGGGAVKLTDDADVTIVLGIGEGIESTLSIRELPDLATIPVWSVLNAGGIKAFPALPGIETVWIAADNDVSGTGQKAARAAAERLHASDIEAIILAPTTAGADLNDKVARRA